MAQLQMLTSACQPHSLFPDVGARLDGRDGPGVSGDDKKKENWWGGWWAGGDAAAGCTAANEGVEPCGGELAKGMWT